MLRKDSYPKLYAGVDESNHGYDHEVFTIVVSPFKVDAEIYLTNKQTRVTEQNKAKRLWNPLQKRAYKYALVNRAHYEKYGQHQLIKEVVRELVTAIRPDYDTIEIFIDGHLTSQQRGATKREVAKIACLRYPEVGIHSVPKRKNKEGMFKTNYLLSTADSLANFLFRNYNTPDLERGGISRNRVSFN